MGSSNGIIRIGRKGMRKFAFGEDGPAFEVDVVVAFHRWIEIDDGFRKMMTDDDGSSRQTVPMTDMPRYHKEAVAFVAGLGGGTVTTAEALDFLARLREQYDELADFFRPRSPQERASPVTTGAPSGLEFAVEEI